jgi:predicted regulator of Ras-like GTPase activity (Roadblock/LC7/MglB family)
MNMEASLKELMNIDGAIGAALIDYNSGMALGTLTSIKDLDLEVVAAGTTDFIRAKMRTLELMRLDEPIEDILVTLVSQYHVIRPLTSRTGKGLFLYLMLDKTRANLALARHKITTIERELEM